MLKILKEDLHLIVVIIAAVAAVFLETLGLMPEKYVPPLILLLLALLAIWGEPFMAAYPGTVLSVPRGQSFEEELSPSNNQTHPQEPQSYIPRYYIVIKSYSDLIPRLKDIWDKYSFKH